MTDMTDAARALARRRSLTATASAAVATLALIATRWTPRPGIRSGLLIVATVAVIGRALAECERRPADPASAWLRRVADGAIVFAVGICAGSKEGPILGGLAVATVLALSFTNERRMSLHWRTGVVAAGTVAGAVLVLFGRYLHAWMQVPLIVLVLACGTAAMLNARDETTTSA